MRIVFAGTPDFAAQHLSALLGSDHQVVAVYSQPDRPAGRGKKLTASAVKQLALQHNLVVKQPVSLKSSDAQRELAELNADIMIVVAYGLILPQAILQTPRLGCLNVHGSILPKWRGAAPIQRAIWAGDTQTGVTIMQMDEGLDTGDILHIDTLDIEATDTSASLYDKLAQIGPQALLHTLQQLPNLTPQPQDDRQASYAQKLSKQEAQINWKLPAEQLARNVRAFNPWPMAFIAMHDGPVKIWQAGVSKHQQTAQPGEIIQADKQGILVACGERGDQGILLQSIQIPGKKALPVQDVLNARKDWFLPGRLLP